MDSETSLNQTAAESLPDVINSLNSNEDIVVLITNLFKLLQLLVDNRDLQDSFRRYYGFERLIEVLNSCQIDSNDETKISETINIVKCVFNICAVALSGNKINKKYANEKISLDIWTNILSQSQLPKFAPTQLFGILFSFVTNDFSHYSIFQSVLQYVKSSNTLKNKSSDLSTNDSETEIDLAIQNRINYFINIEQIENYEFISLILHFLDLQDDSTQFLDLKIAVILSLNRLAKISIVNKYAIHRATILQKIIPLLWNENINPRIRHSFLKLSYQLLEFGCDLTTTKFLISESLNSASAADFLLNFIQRSKSPDFFLFDFSFITPPILSFSPLSEKFPSSDGYTFSSWIKFFAIDDKIDTLIMSFNDSSQKPIESVFIDAKSSSIAVRSLRKTSYFKNYKVPLNQWIHLAICHKKGNLFSKATLYINGSLVEVVKCVYLPSGLLSNGSISFGRTEAFYNNLPCAFTSTKYALSTSFVFNDLQSTDDISVIYSLGPSYHGTFQGFIGNFLTYRSAALLNKSFENSKSVQKKSGISAILRDKIHALPESKIILGFNPQNVSESTGFLKQYLSSTDELKFSLLVRNNVAVFNSANGKFSNLFSTVCGVGTFPSIEHVILHSPLEDKIWSLGGVAIGLRLLHDATSYNMILNSCNVIFELIQESWRNSDDFENCRGFSIMGNLLKSKSLPKDNTQLLSLCLNHIGYSKDSQNCIIANPLAYRVLILDYEIWRNSGDETISLYFDQLTEFITGPENGQYNSRRLNGMRIVKKLVQIFKGIPMRVSTLPNLLEAVKAIITTCATSENLKSIALFITYAFQTKQISINGPSRSQSGIFDVSVNGDDKKENNTKSNNNNNSNTKINNSSYKNNDELTIQELAIHILQSFFDVLCLQENIHLIKKFARTITIKWALYLLTEDDSRVVIQGLRIISRLLKMHGRLFYYQFKQKTNGFFIILDLLPKWSDNPIIWAECISIMFGIDLENGSVLEGENSLTYSITAVLSKEDVVVIVPDMLQILLKMISSAISSSYGKPLSSKIRNGYSISSAIECTTVVSTFFTELRRTSKFFSSLCISDESLNLFLNTLFESVKFTNYEKVDATTELNSKQFLSKIALVTFISPVYFTHHIDFVLAPSTLIPLISEQFPVISDLRQISQNGNYEIPTTRNEINDAALSALDALVDNCANLIIEAMFSKKDLTGLDIFANILPSYIEERIYLETALFKQVYEKIDLKLSQSKDLLFEGKCFLNIIHFLSLHIDKGIFARISGGAELLLSLFVSIVEGIQYLKDNKSINFRLSQGLLETFVSIVQKSIVSTLTDEWELNSSVVIAQILTDNKKILSFLYDYDETFFNLIYYNIFPKLSSSSPNREFFLQLWITISISFPKVLGGIKNSSDGKFTEEYLNNLLSQDFMFLSEYLDTYYDKLKESLNLCLEPLWITYSSKVYKQSDQYIKNFLRCRNIFLREEINSKDKVSKNVSKYLNSLPAWKNGIFSAEHMKFLRNMQDIQDDVRFFDTEYQNLMQRLHHTTNQFFAHDSIHWRLDFTEGRDRMRLRLSPSSDKMFTYLQDKSLISKMLSTGDESPSKINIVNRGRSRSRSKSLISEKGSGIGTETGRNLFISTKGSASTEPASDSPLLKIEDEYDMIEEIPDDNLMDVFEDKNRKVLRSLEVGDIVLEIWNVNRIVGLQPIPCLLIIGKNNLYLLDNYFQRNDGEIIDASDAPVDENDSYVQLITDSSPQLLSMFEEDDPHKVHRWSTQDLMSMSRRKFLFRDVAVEIFFSNGRNFLITASDKKIRDSIYNKLFGLTNSGSERILDSASSYFYSPDLFLSITGQIGSKIAHVFGSGSEPAATSLWVKGQLSNFAYLMILNTMAGRTFNDLTQYPVFPWVLSDYESDELDLSNPEVYRDLSKPVGAQNSVREKEFIERYKAFEEMNDSKSPAFHYGTHYSSSMIVSSYLIRLFPYVKLYLLLQGGQFDHADRLFYSIPQAWKSASQTSTTDVRELIPEFYYLPEFLINANKFDLGVRQTCETVNDVELPPWAKNDPRIFIEKHRQALESPYVSKNLHHWIDLIFGYKQSGTEAIKATNVFHYLSYAGSVNLDSIEDPVQRKATAGIIHNFGQTPYKLFSRPHSARKIDENDADSINSYEFNKAPTHVQSFQFPVRRIKRSLKTMQIIGYPIYCCPIDNNCENIVECDFIDGSIRFYSSELRNRLGIIEQSHLSRVNIIDITSDYETLITSGQDSVINVWKVYTTKSIVYCHLKGLLRGHFSSVISIAVSRIWNIIVSISHYGQVIIWDLNNLSFVKEITLSDEASSVCIDDRTGNIGIVSGSILHLFSINGESLLDHDTKSFINEKIHSVSFIDDETESWKKESVIITGHSRGSVKIWKVLINFNKYTLEQIGEYSPYSSKDSSPEVPITALYFNFSIKSLYAGDSNGNVYKWDIKE